MTGAAGLLLDDRVAPGNTWIDVARVTETVVGIGVG